MKAPLLVTLISVALASLTSCGLQKDPGANIGISVTPEVANIVPGKGISCAARASAKADDSTPTADVEGDRVTFSRFALQWRSGDKLSIAAITATIYSKGVSGAEEEEGLEIAIDEEEAIALLGLTDLTIQYANPYPGPGGEPRSTTVDSTVGKATAFEPCGLQLGGLSSVDGVTSYTARVKIEVVGFGTTCDTKDVAGVCTGGTEYPVRQSVTVRAQKY